MQRNDAWGYLPGGVVFDNPFAAGVAGLSVGAGAAEGMVDYSDPVATGVTNQYELGCFGEAANPILTLSNG